MLGSSPRTDITMHPDCTAAAEQTARLLRDLGHDVEPACPAGLGEPEALRTYVTIVSSSVALALDTAAEKIGRPVGPGDVEPLTWTLAEIGHGCSAARYLAAVEFMHRFGRQMAAWWVGGFDLLLTPTTAQPPPRLGALASSPEAPLEGFLRAAPYGAFTAVFNMTGQPAISLPLHWTADGLPLGVQLVAAFGREDILLRVAAQLEQAQPWKDRRPPQAASLMDAANAIRAQLGCRGEHGEQYHGAVRERRIPCVQLHIARSRAPTSTRTCVGPDGSTA